MTDEEDEKEENDKQKEASAMLSIGTKFNQI